jgi:hypothetical protein
LRAKGFFCSLNVLSGGLVFDPNNVILFSDFGSSKPWIRIGGQAKKLDPDPYQMNTDPKHCQKVTFLVIN